MFKITVIGLGVDANDLPFRAKELIKSHQVVIARTGETLSFKLIKQEFPNVKTLDGVYLKSRNFDTLNKNLGDEVIKLAKTSSVCYLVDGSAIEDNSVSYILKKVKDVEIIAGVSHTAKCLERARVSSPNVCSVTCYDINVNEISLPLVVTAIDSPIIASSVKLALSDRFGEEIDVFVTDNNGAKKIKLYELDRLSSYGYSTCLYIPSLPLTQKQRFDFSDLMTVLEVLRAPNGCPWDREQTEKSILKNVIEEAYELVDAVESEDDDMIIEETGDLILQSAFYLTFGEEDSRFSRYDVLSELCSKLIYRHSHVFGNDKAGSGEDALGFWNANKIKEKGYETASEYLSAVPSAMPAVMRAEKVGKRAGKYGFDFASVKDAISKLKEEILELETAISSKNSIDIEGECGDLMFSAVNILRLLGVEGELALKNSTEKFIKRFTLVENEVINRGKTLGDYTAEELDAIYNQVKRGE